MNYQLEPLMEEIICNSLEANNIPGEIIDKIIEEIKYDCKETNYLHNSIADSNYYAAEERKENDLIKRLRKENEELQDKFSKEREDYAYENRRLRNVIEDLRDSIN